MAARLEAPLRRRRRPMRRRQSRDTFWQEGDPTFDTQEMREKRTALRNNIDVGKALDEWWSTTDADGNGVIDREEYIELGKALYRVMIADGNEEAAQKSAETDWDEDSKGQTVMSSEHFKLAIFELADLWTSTLDSKEYVEFLMDLLQKMKAVGLGQSLLSPAPAPAPAMVSRRRDSLGRRASRELSPKAPSSSAAASDAPGSATVARNGKAPVASASNVAPYQSVGSARQQPAAGSTSIAANASAQGAGPPPSLSVDVPTNPVDSIEPPKPLAASARGAAPSLRSNADAPAASSASGSVSSRAAVPNRDAAGPPSNSSRPFWLPEPRSELESRPKEARAPTGAGAGPDLDTLLNTACAAVASHPGAELPSASSMGRPRRRSRESMAPVSMLPTSRRSSREIDAAQPMAFEAAVQEVQTFFQEIRPAQPARAPEAPQSPGDVPTTTLSSALTPRLTGSVLHGANGGPATQSTNQLKRVTDRHGPPQWQPSDGESNATTTETCGRPRRRSKELTEMVVKLPGEGGMEAPPGLASMPWNAWGRGAREPCTSGHF